MDDMLAKGYAKKSTSPVPLGKTCYITHHGVFNTNKPGKIRLVLTSRISSFEYLSDIEKNMLL